MKYLLSTFIFGLVIFLVLFIIQSYPSSYDNYLLQSESGCCTIHVKQTDELEYVVTYIDNKQGWTEIRLVEIEYYDSKVNDYTIEQELEMELDETINSFQEYCYRNH